MTLKMPLEKSRLGNEHKTAGQRGCELLKNLGIARKTLHDLRKRENVRFPFGAPNHTGASASVCAK
jgi:hypothetical protein